MRAIRLLTLHAALLLLFAQCVPALWQMQCDHTGLTTTRWYGPRSGCALEEARGGSATFKRLCCTFSHAQADMDSQQRTPPLMGKAVDRVLVAELPAALNVLYVAEPRPCLLHGPPPRGATLDAQAQLGIFRL